MWTMIHGNPNAPYSSTSDCISCFSASLFSVVTDLATRSFSCCSLKTEGTKQEKNSGDVGATCFVQHCVYQDNA